MEQQEYAQRGYLREDLRLFHLKGAMEEQLDWHYQDRKSTRLNSSHKH